MRPNLMSSSTRRASSEDNILAMLERDSARRGSSSRMAWYGTCSALAVVLVGALAWLAYDNGALHEDQMLTPVAVAPIPAVAAGPASTVVMATPAPGVAAAPRPAAIQPARAATIVDAAPEPMRLAEAGPPPAKPSTSSPAPLVLLSPDEAASIQHAAAARAPAREAAPRREPPKALRVRAPVPRAEPKRAPAVVAAPVHKRIAARVPAPRIRPAVHTPVRLVAHPGMATPRLKKAQPPAPQVTEAPVDNDVALISAIISRSAGHAAEHAPARPDTRP
jgi:hypothetical protein